MIRKYLFFLLIIITMVAIQGCLVRPINKEMEIGMSLTNRAVEYNLQGQNKMALFTYTRAIGKFRDMGKFCDMARVSLIMFTIDDFKNNKALNDARGFATLGECAEEMNVVNFLSGSTFDIKKLPEPYHAFAQYRKTGSIRRLLGIARRSSSSKKIKSLLYRFIAREVMDKNPSLSFKYINEAIKIDEKSAWTKNILEDEFVILDASKKMGLSTTIVEGRINILRKALNEKY